MPDVNVVSGVNETRILTKRLRDRPDDSWTIDGAIAGGAYESLRAVLAKGEAADVQEQVKLSGLRGRGGGHRDGGLAFATGTPRHDLRLGAMGRT